MLHISETGYFEYAEEKKAEYKEQYDNGEKEFMILMLNIMGQHLPLRNI